MIRCFRCLQFFFGLPNPIYQDELINDGQIYVQKLTQEYPKKVRHALIHEKYFESKCVMIKQFLVASFVVSNLFSTWNR